MWVITTVALPAEGFRGVLGKARHHHSRENVVSFFFSLLLFFRLDTAVFFNNVFTGSTL